MSGYQITSIPETENYAATKGWPGEIKYLKDPLGTKQVAVTYRKMPPETGAKGGYGHKHKTQEEIFIVTSGTLQFKLDDEIKDVSAPAAVRIDPAVVRGVWNATDQDAELLIVSTRADDLDDETELVKDFWPAD